MNLELEITIVDPLTEVELTATVQVVIIGSTAVTAIAPSRTPTPDEQEALLLAIEEAVQEMTGSPVTRDGAQMCHGRAEASASMRRHFGGGQG